MAKAKKEKKPKSMEAALWKSCDKLRGSVEPAEYKHVVLSLIFLKYAGDRFEQRKHELEEQGLQDYISQVEFYTAENVFYLPPACRWSYIMENAKQDNIFQIIDDALNEIEKKNKQLTGALPNNYYSNLGLDKTKFASLLDEINKLDTQKDKDNDLMGRVYEYFLGKFAIAEGKKGEYYTPKSVVNLIAELIEPYDGKIYDPCCGSGGMFVQSVKFVAAHGGNQRNVSVYGQENINTTYKLARMNLAIRGISADIRQGDTFHNDQHKDLKADYIMANPPFNQSDWREENQLRTDGRWMGYETPPTSNANYGWILHMLSKLSTDGVAGFLLANGALSADSAPELAIRTKLIEKGKVEAIIVLPKDLFYSTNISVTLWILNNNKKARVTVKNGKEIHYRDREQEILFMDLRGKGSPFEKKYVELGDKLRERVADTYHSWQQEGHEQNYHDEPEFCQSVNLATLKGNGYSLVASKYIQFLHRDSDIDFEKEMGKIAAEMRDIRKERIILDNELSKLFSEFGINIG